jgi:hypothetical protein
MKPGTFFLHCCLALLLCACSGGERTAPQRGFYFWKNTQSKLNPDEQKLLSELKTQKLYVKLFEVDLNGSSPTPISKTELELEASAFPNGEIVPVVYVRNEVLKEQTAKDLNALADNICHLVKKLYGEHFPAFKKGFNELQIDCDWTPSTKQHYFALLKAVKKQSRKTLSCTLRLYPYKYRKNMGIPPVDRAMLMCYNLLPPLAYEDRNSILETKELAAYLEGTAAYPLPLDVALPVFSWIHVYHNRQFSGVLNRSEAELKSHTKRLKPLWYEVTSEFTLEGQLLRPGDRLKCESASPETIANTIRLLNKHLEFDETTTLSLYHLDSDQLQQYDHETLSGFYSGFGH